MDPNENLKEQLDIARAIISELDTDMNLSPFKAKASRLADLVDALDGWIVNGGFLPERWQKK